MVLSVEEGSRNSEFREQEEAGFGLGVGVTNARNVGEPTGREESHGEVVIPSSDYAAGGDEIPFAPVLQVEYAWKVFAERSTDEADVVVRPPYATGLRSNRVLRKVRDSVVKRDTYQGLEYGGLIAQSQAPTYVDAIPNVQQRAGSEEEVG
jgi:hypothetical protein